MLHYSIYNWFPCFKAMMYLYDSVLAINYKKNYRQIIDRIRDKYEG